MPEPAKRTWLLICWWPRVQESMISPWIFFVRKVTTIYIQQTAHKMVIKADRSIVGSAEKDE